MPTPKKSRLLDGVIVTPYKKCSECNSLFDSKKWGEKCPICGTRLHGSFRTKMIVK